MNGQLLQWLYEETALPEQGTQEWLHARRRLITASVVPDLLGVSKNLYEVANKRCKAIDDIELKIKRNYHTRAEIMKQKTNPHYRPPKKTAQYILDRGQLCEHLIRDNIERMHYHMNAFDVFVPLKFRVKDGWLGASPDGCFNTPLRLLEIKTLVYREMETNTIPHNYWVQMQIQMYVYGVTQCEYAEARVEFLTTYGEWKYGHLSGPRGVAVRDSSGAVYTCPMDLSFDEWHDTQVIEAMVQYGVEILYYYIPHSQILQISYDKEWMDNHCLPRLKETYHEMQEMIKQRAAAKPFSVMKKPGRGYKSAPAMSVTKFVNYEFVNNPAARRRREKLREKLLEKEKTEG